MKRAVWCLMILLAACGGNTPQATPPEATQKEDAVEKTKPTIEVPEGKPPKELVSEDIEEGDGAEAKAGATVTIHYVGVSWSTGKEFDSSWSRGAPATFPLGQLIKGWQQGIPGMKEGGRRQLTIPPELAYGDTPPPGIEPGETLIFVIDLYDADAA